LVVTAPAIAGFGLERLKISLDSCNENLPVFDILQNCAYSNERRAQRMARTDPSVRVSVLALLVRLFFPVILSVLSSFALVLQAVTETARYFPCCLQARGHDPVFPPPVTGG
jgi:hypothetical protein